MEVLGCLEDHWMDAWKYWDACCLIRSAFILVYIITNFMSTMEGLELAPSVAVSVRLAVYKISSCIIPISFEDRP